MITLGSLVRGVTAGAVSGPHRLATFLRRLALRVRPPQERPAGPPIERLARDGRRLRAELLAIAPGTPMARRIGVSRAYDDVLAEACRTLEVPDTLTGLPPGIERDAERLHVEHRLDAAGLRLGA